jgi:hypothetical protein
MNKKIAYVYNDAGRKQSRPSERKDCTVRALAISAKTNYVVAHDFLKERGRRCRKTFLFPKKRSDDYALGYAFIWKSFPLRWWGKKRMNPERFAIEFSKGVYICKTVRHVYVVIDGVINDIEEVSWFDGKCVYGCWKVIKEIS